MEEQRSDGDSEALIAGDYRNLLRRRAGLEISELEAAGSNRQQRVDPPENLLRLMWRLKRRHLRVLTGRLVLSNLTSFHFLPVFSSVRSVPFGVFFVL